MFYSQEEIAKAREPDLLTYLQQAEPEQLVYLSRGTYTVREHPSLKISNGKWMWWSHGIGGYTALDYLIKVREIAFPKAVSMILRKDPAPPALSSRAGNVSSKRLLLPDESKTNDRVIKYLEKRGIHPGLVKACIEKGILYESLPYHNAVFLGSDEDGIVRYAFYRSTNQEKIMGEAAGSDKRYPFRIDHDSTTLHVFESAIDLLSYATLQKMWTGKWPRESMLSLGGVYVPSEDPEKKRLPAGLRQRLDNYPDIRQILLHLDYDTAGRNAASAIIKKLKSSYDIEYQPPRYGKDMNDELLFLLKQVQLQSERKDANGNEYEEQDADSAVPGSRETCADD